MNKVERGATLVEGALVIPIWIMFFVAMTDMYFMVSAYMNLTSFSREALYLGGIMNDRFLGTSTTCYTTGTSVNDPGQAYFAGIDSACGSLAVSYLNADAVNANATGCVAINETSDPSPSGVGCGHRLLQDKIFLLARSDKLIPTSPTVGTYNAPVGTFSALHAITRRGTLTASVTGTVPPGGGPATITNVNVPTIYVSVRGDYRGMFPIFNGIAIRTKVSGPHSRDLLPTTDTVW